MRHATTIVLFLFAAEIQWIAAVPVNTSAVYVVRSVCPNSAEQCFTLNNLIKFMVARNFSSNTTLLFSYGTHVIGDDIGTIQKLTFDGLYQLQISAFGNEVDENSMVSSIQCSTRFNFEFKNITDLKISRLSFDNCGSVQNYIEFVFNITLWVKNTTTFTVENVTITNTKGVGLLIENVHQNLSLFNVHLSNNEVNCFIEYNSETFPSLDYSITNSSFSFGDALKPGKYYQDGHSSSSKPIIGSGGLHIRLANAGTVRLINNIHHENRGLHGNLYLELLAQTSEHVTSVMINGLTSTFVSKMESKSNTLNKGIVLKRIPHYFTFNVRIVNSTFKRSCVIVLFVSVTIENVSIEESTCFASLNLLKAQDDVLRNLNITQTSGQHTLNAYQSSVILKNQVRFQDNLSGVRLERNSRIAFDTGSNTYFMNNIATTPQSHDASVLYAEDSEIVAVSNSYIKFENNTSTDGGAITVVNSSIGISGINITLLLIRNTGTNGGAMAMYDGSRMTVLGNRHILVRFIGNTAIQKGGAIYVDTSSYLVKRNKIMKEFIKIETYTRQCPTFEYKNNTAPLSGNSLYGGWLIQKSQLCSLIDTKNTNNTLLSSDPVRVCICNNNSIPDCNILEHPIELYPGQKFEMKAVAVGWEFGTVPSIVQARFEVTSNKTRLKASQYVQSVNRNCTKLSYKVYSQNMKERLHLFVEKHNIPDNIPNSTLMRQDLVVNISVKGCPPGFSFNNTLSLCICHPFLLRNNIECDMERYLVIQTGQVWIKASDNISGITISKYCSYDYCNGSSEFKLLDLEYPDNQCAFKRSGVLCGVCQTGLSQVLGTSNCKKCSSLWVLLIVPVFILAGIALVVCIMALNMTVTVGTINGLIFYANIVRANQTVFFPAETSNSFLSWFVAWINLDFGIEACFYNGLDAYAKT